VDSSQSARTGALLLLGVARAGAALGAGQDAARGEDQDMAVGELLLELTGEALLNPVEARQGRDGDKDDNSLLAVANFDLIQTQSQHASSRTKPWTASRPVPQKSIVLWRGKAPILSFAYARVETCSHCAASSTAW
jgi:hypothetical protein